MANAAEPVLEGGAIELPIIGPLRDRFIGLPRDCNIDVKVNGRKATYSHPGRFGLHFGGHAAHDIPGTVKGDGKTYHYGVVIQRKCPDKCSRKMSVGFLLSR